jgi:phosphatidylglycerophosphate synthase
VRAREIYTKTRKIPDLFWNAYVCRPLAALLLSGIAGTRITPNQITLLSLVVAAASAAILIGVPGYLGLVAGIVVFELSYVLDCADGMLARWRGIASETGHLLDFLIDEIKAFIVLSAVAFRLYLERSDPWFLELGLLGLLALATGIALTTFLRRPEVAGPRSATASARGPRSGLGRLIALVESAAKFVIHYPSYVLYAALAGRIELYLYPYVVVNGLYALRALASVTLRFGRL